jgi:putative transposase
VRQRVARSRELVAEGDSPSAVARVAKISRQALYRRPKPRSAPPASSGSSGRGNSGTWVAEHGWCYLNAIIDCCTREIVGWSLDLRCRAKEAIAVFETAVATSGFAPDELHVVDPDDVDAPPALTLGTDNGSAFTSRAFRARLGEQGVRHRRGGYRDPESQAFIESWFGKLKEREVWLNEYETLDDARRGIGGYVDRYHHRPHSGLNDKTPLEVRQTWEDLQNIAA